MSDPQEPAPPQAPLLDAVQRGAEGDDSAVDDQDDEPEAAQGKRDGRAGRKIVKQTKIPQLPLARALGVARGLVESFAGQPTPPVRLALALEVSPQSSVWRSVTGAAEAYGLTKGAYKSDTLALTPLGRRAVAPTAEGDDQSAMREAIRKPTIPAALYEKYNHNRWPSRTVVENTLQFDFDLPKDRAVAAYDVIYDNAVALGLIKPGKGGEYLLMDEGPPTDGTADTSSAQTVEPQQPRTTDQSPAPMTERAGHGPEESSVRTGTAPVQAGVQPVSSAPPRVGAHPAAAARMAAPTQQSDRPRLRGGLEVDHYRLVRRCGTGFSAEVWEAEVVAPPPGIDLAAGDRVAMKHYQLVQMRRSEILRIDREFQLATQIRHPNVARVFELVLAPSRPNHNFLVMELVDGMTLKDAIPPSGLPFDRVLSYATQLFSALAEVHSAGALHRDIKASNIMLSQRDELDTSLRLCDFGIVSVLGSDPGFTGTGFLGSKHSAPLEQLLGEALDHRADIYSAGAVLYHCYTGAQTYTGFGTEAAIAGQMQRNPVRLLAKDEGVRSAQFVELVNRCLSVEKGRRPSSAEDCLEQVVALRIAS